MNGTRFYRAKAPLRLGFGGGGTDIADYSAVYGGAVINATVSRYAHATIEPLTNGTIEFCSQDLKRSIRYPAADFLPTDGEFRLIAGVYNRIVRDFAKEPLSFRLCTAVDAPPGSGLGSSSTLVVVIIGAFCEWLNIPLGEYDIARLAYEVEREDLGISGGKQDQFAATFGGFNFMEFNRDGSVLVNPLRVRHDIISELEHNLLLLNTSASRYSAAIIDTQRRYIQSGDAERLQALHEVKESAYAMKRSILTGALGGLGKILRAGWESKKRSSEHISNAYLDSIMEAACSAGALGGKISGAGGGGFMMLYCPGISRYAVADRLKEFDVTFADFHFVKHGLVTWSIA